MFAASTKGSIQSFLSRKEKTEGIKLNKMHEQLCK